MARKPQGLTQKNLTKILKLTQPVVVDMEKGVKDALIKGCIDWNYENSWRYNN